MINVIMLFFGVTASSATSQGESVGISLSSEETVFDCIKQIGGREPEDIQDFTVKLLKVNDAQLTLDEDGFLITLLDEDETLGQIDITLTTLEELPEIQTLEKPSLVKIWRLEDGSWCIWLRFKGDGYYISIVFHYTASGHFYIYYRILFPDGTYIVGEKLIF